MKHALPGAIVIKGVFPESAIPTGPVAFVHLDCDQYQSIMDSVCYLLPKMLPGGVIWFDDYGHLDGATRAVDALFGPGIIRAKCNKVYVRV